MIDTHKKSINNNNFQFGIYMFIDNINKSIQYKYLIKIYKKNINNC